MTVDDSFRTDAMTHLLGGKPRKAKVATCPHDNEPLVCTLEFRGAEFICVVCNRKYGFMAPKPAEETPELMARHDELQALYEAARAERQAAQ